MEIVTTDLAQFGSREMDITIKLLTSWQKHGLPNNFLEKEIIIMFNKESGNVFLTNSEYQVAMLNGNKIELFYSCPVCGHEGFLEEMEKHGEENEECQKFLREIQV